MAMLDKLPKSGFKYALAETYFHEKKQAQIPRDSQLDAFIPDATFVLWGHLSLEGNNRLSISVLAKPPIWRPGNAPLDLKWVVNLSLSKNGDEISRKTVRRHFNEYFTPAGSTVIGEETFDLPEFTDRNVVILKLEGTYFANFGLTLPSVRPLEYPARPTTAIIRKEFHLRVEYAD